ncbi:MAG: hypothetical protein M1608_06745 [Candidatus Omnitrophica bacterium]|nr:hypothetical protein [Candidatus Omnitrophota bacterium]
MKKSLLTLALVTAGIPLVFAQTTPPATAPNASQTQTKKHMKKHKKHVKKNANTATEKK